MKRKWLIVLMGGLVLVGIVASGALASQRVDVGFNGKRIRAYIHPEKDKREIKVMLRKESKVEAAGVLSKLELTAEQREKVGKLQVVFQKDSLKLRLQLAEKQLELRRLLLEDPPVQEEIEALVDEMGTVRAEIQKKSISFRMRLEDILTEEQLVKLRRREGTRSRAEIMWKNRVFCRFR